MQAQREAERGGGTDWVFNEIFAHLQNDLAHQRCASSAIVRLEL